MTKTILLADDSVTIQKVVELTFMDEDFDVSAVSNGAEAIARLGETQPDVVITDVHMPGANGFEVCRRSKELYPTVPVLLLVGTFEGFDADEAMRCGADGHLKKPFDSQELMRRVRELASAPSRSLPVPPATPDFTPFAVPAAAAASATFAASATSATSDSAPEVVADDIYALPTPAEELWETLPEEAPAEDVRGPYVPSETRADTATRFVAVQSAPEPLPSAFSSFLPATEPASAAPAPVASAGAALSDADIDRIARRMVELVGDKAVRDVAWEVVPDLAEVLLKSRIRELESSID